MGVKLEVLEENFAAELAALRAKYEARIADLEQKAESKEKILHLLHATLAHFTMNHEVAYGKLPVAIEVTRADVVVGDYVLLVAHDPGVICAQRVEASEPRHGIVLTVSHLAPGVVYLQYLPARE